MYRTNHFIQRQVLEIETPDAAAGLGFRQEVTDVFYQKIMPQLEKLFDEEVQGNQLISIEYLPVNIEIEDAKNWQDELVRKAVRQISLALRESPKKLMNIGFDSSLEEETDHSSMDEFFYFLEHGYLRWNVSMQSPGAFETVLKKELSFYTIQQKEICYQSLLRVFSENNHAVSRLCYQFSSQFIQALIADEPLLQTLEHWKLYFKELNHETAFRLMFIKAWAKKKSNSVLINDDELLAQTLLENVTGRMDMQDWYQQLPLPAQTFIHRMLKEDLNKTITTEKKNEMQHTDAKETEEDCFYVGNAGLIITHVFLKNFFEAAGLWQNKMFINETAHQRAVLLTAYLVNEETEFPEYHLLLNKILCGFPAEQSLQLTIDITGQEKTESAELLQTIINNWKYNGRAVCTTIENLWSSFLQRNGKLTKANDGWLLQVEQQGYDILLNGLPWGIGTIKLPWMENILHVEWI